MVKQLFSKCDICGKSSYLEDTGFGIYLCQECFEENDTEKDIFAEIEVTDD